MPHEQTLEILHRTVNKEEVKGIQDHLPSDIEALVSMCPWLRMLGCSTKVSLLTIFLIPVLDGPQAGTRDKIYNVIWKVCSHPQYDGFSIITIVIRGHDTISPQCETKEER